MKKDTKDLVELIQTAFSEVSTNEDRIKIISAIFGCMPSEALEEYLVKNRWAFKFQKLFEYVFNSTSSLCEIYAKDLGYAMIKQKPDLKDIERIKEKLLMYQNKKEVLEEIRNTVNR